MRHDQEPKSPQLHILVPRPGQGVQLTWFWTHAWVQTDAAYLVVYATKLDLDRWTWVALTGHCRGAPRQDHISRSSKDMQASQAARLPYCESLSHPQLVQPESHQSRAGTSIDQTAEVVLIRA